MKRILTYGYLLFLFSCTASQQESSELERLKAENEALKRALMKISKKKKRQKIANIEIMYLII